MAGLISSLRTICAYANAKRNFMRWQSREALEAWQDKQTMRHIRRIMSCSPFYRALYEGRDLREWRDFPVIQKREMMKQFDALNTVGISCERAFEVALHAEKSRDFSPMIGGIAVGLSSGTSGSRGIFLASPAERDLWAGTILARILPRGITGRHRAALFLRANSNLYENVGTRRLAFQFFDLLSPWDDSVRKLVRFAPTILVAPPSVLLRLARSSKWAPVERVFAAAEVLEPQDAVELAAAFSCGRIHQIYQATEGFIAATCTHGILHVNEDVIALQTDPLGNGRCVPIFTDFRRFTQPIMRYRLNDVLRLRTEPCPCGSIFTAIEAVEGRCDDILSAPSQSGEGRVEIFPDFIRRAIITAHHSILEYSVVEKSGCWEIAVETDLPADELHIAIARALESTCAQFGAQCPLLKFVPYMPPEVGAKLRRIRR
jgi:putative adenylate-forming enzyme